MDIDPKLIVNTKNYKYNIDLIREYINKDVSIMLVLKDNAYGHGAINLAKTANEMCVYHFAVKSLDEAIKLRINGIRGEILVLGEVGLIDLKKVAIYDISITISNFAALNHLLKNIYNHIKVHVKIDTGFNRRGFSIRKLSDYKNILKTFHLLENNRHIKICGIYTHFSSVDTDALYVKYQLEVFKNLLKYLDDRNIKYGIPHSANSQASIQFQEAHFKMIRIGIFSYGYMTCKGFEIDIIKPKPVMSLKASIINIFKISKGEYIGYDKSFQALNDMTVGIVNLGYANGFPRVLSNKVHILVNGHKARILGKISMDVLAIDMTHINLSLYDEITIFGENFELENQLDYYANKANTITYELLCNIGNSISKKIFI